MTKSAKAKNARVTEIAYQLDQEMVSTAMNDLNRSKNGIVTLNKGELLDVIEKMQHEITYLSAQVSGKFETLTDKFVCIIELMGTLHNLEAERTDTDGNTFVTGANSLQWNSDRAQHDVPQNLHMAIVWNEDQQMIKADKYAALQVEHAKAAKANNQTRVRDCEQQMDRLDWAAERTREAILSYRQNFEAAVDAYKIVTGSNFVPRAKQAKKATNYQNKPSWATS